MRRDKRGERVGKAKGSSRPGRTSNKRQVIIVFFSNVSTTIGYVHRKCPGIPYICCGLGKNDVTYGCQMSIVVNWTSKEEEFQ